MKFLYQYRTPDNKQHRGVIRAASKEAAYAALKANGIRPGRVDEAPGFFNKLFGKGKRWTVIAVLGIALGVSLSVAFRMRRNAVRTIRESMFEDRSQLYGDPVVIGRCEGGGWTNVFADAFDLALARYAIPGRLVVSGPVPVKSVKMVEPLDIGDDELAEVAQMKRMVNGIKRELAEYLSDGGTVSGFFRRLDVRQRAERGFYETARFQILGSKDPVFQNRKNAELRAMGLPMVATDSQDE